MKQQDTDKVENNMVQQIPPVKAIHLTFSVDNGGELQRGYEDMGKVVKQQDKDKDKVVEELL